MSVKCIRLIVYIEHVLIELIQSIVALQQTQPVSSPQFTPSGGGGGGGGLTVLSSISNASSTTSTTTMTSTTSTTTTVRDMGGGEGRRE